MQFLVYILQWPAVKSMRREKQSEIQTLLESSLKIRKYPKALGRTPAEPEHNGKDGRDMLYETIAFPDNAPLQCSIVEVEE